MKTLREISEELEAGFAARLVAGAQQPSEIVTFTGLPKDEFVPDEIIPAKWPENEKRYFVWIDGWKGAGFVYAGEFEAQICVEDFLPKKGVLHKELLAHEDKRTIDQLKIDYPWPLVKVSDFVGVNISTTEKIEAEDFFCKVLAADKILISTNETMEFINATQG